MSGNRGTGPGPRTQDGCSVELYRRLPAYGEVERFAHLVPPTHTVLELGCGAGRLTRELLARGHPVVSVDNSEEMLALLPTGARKVLADIEDLDLGQAFDVVLLASCLVNTPDPRLRSRLLAACRRHLEPGGLLVFERHDPAWLDEAEPGPAGSAGVEFFIDHVARRTDSVEMTLRYRHGEEEWTHSFVAARLHDEDIEDLLAAAGFGPPTWLDARRRWGATAARD
jgi:SAM-dependent methyltransferase